jgi:hypothetical protein
MHGVGFSVLMNDEFDRIRKMAAESYFVVPSRYLSEGTEGEYVKSTRTAYIPSGFEKTMSLIQARRFFA